MQCRVDRIPINHLHIGWFRNYVGYRNRTMFAEWGYLSTIHHTARMIPELHHDIGIYRGLSNDDTCQSLVNNRLFRNYIVWCWVPESPEGCRMSYWHQLSISIWWYPTSSACRWPLTQNKTKNTKLFLLVVLDLILCFVLTYTACISTIIFSLLNK